MTSSVDFVYVIVGSGAGLANRLTKDGRAGVLLEAMTTTPESAIDLLEPAPIAMGWGG